jgi:hypothetical protein
MATHEQRFSSKVDWWYFATMGLVVVATSIAATPVVLAGRWWIAATLLAPIALMVWNLLSTSYLITDDSLTVRCLLFRKTVPLAQVTKLRASRDPSASPALSLDRVEVLYGTGSVLISPKDKRGFIHAIRAQQPAVTIEGLSELL